MHHMLTIGMIFLAHHEKGGKEEGLQGDQA
jgi:hypothetical protein